ncbi:MAG: hypothetical protein NTW14_13090 [bacterium]|nr:hypothetical protein [bacterium]
MSSCPTTPVENHQTLCRLSAEEWTVCYANGCYLNYRCPVYRGCRPSPIRDYIPLPAVFILLESEAIPIYGDDLQRLAG